MTQFDAIALTVGQITGQATNPSIIGPTDVPLNQVHDVALGDSETCAIVGDERRVVCWGIWVLLGTDVLGTTDARGFLTVHGLSGIQLVDNDVSGTCVLDSEGQVWCWGYFSGAESSVPTKIAGYEMKNTLALINLMCALAESPPAEGHPSARSGDVWCWGDMPQRWLYPPSDAWEIHGLWYQDAKCCVKGTRTCGTQWCPPARLGLGRVVQFGNRFAIRDDGELLSWGENWGGEQGDGSEPPNDPDKKDLPHVIPFDGRVRKVVTSLGTRCAVVGAGDVYCWGDHFDEEFDGPRDLVPKKMKFRSHAVDIAMGASFACVLLDDGSVWCWGQNDMDQLGSYSVEFDAHEHWYSPVEVKWWCSTRADDVSLDPMCPN